MQNIDTNTKTEIRKTLELLEDDIHKSWLRDLDKVQELEKLSQILETINSSPTIEEFFNCNQSDFSYFTGKFSQETINNILKQQWVYGPNGDDVALGILLSYLKLFLKFWDKTDKTQYSNLWEAVKDIFDYNKSYYKGSSYNTKVQNDKKLMSAERFNETLMPAKNKNDRPRSL